MRHLLAVLLASSLAVVRIASAQDAASAAPAPADARIADMRKLADEVYDSRFDLTKATKVENLVLKRDTAEWTLNGWVFVKPPVRGLTYRAVFFGDGRFKLRVPIAIERQQVRRYLGTDDVDVPVERVRFDYFDPADQKIFDALLPAATTAAADEARAKSEPAEKWLRETARVYERSLSEDEEARRRLDETGAAANLMDRILNPDEPQSLNAAMEVHVADTVDKSRSHVKSLNYSFQPDALEEVGLSGGFQHAENDVRGSFITTFHESSQYDGSLDWAATSSGIEKEDKALVRMRHVDLHVSFDPAAKRDVKLRARLDLVGKNRRSDLLWFNVTYLVGVTSVRVDGKEAGFFNPEIPGSPGWHSGFVLVALPATLEPGGKVSVEFECEGQLLAVLDGSTWEIREEDNWYPVPSEDGDQSATYDATLVAPKGFTAVTNGREQPCAEGEASPDQVCARFVTNRPIWRETINLGFDVHVDRGTTKDGTPLAVYSNPTVKREFSFRKPTNPDLLQKRSYSLSKGGAGIVQTMIAAHLVYENWFGEDPYDTLSIVPHPQQVGRGFASLILLDQESFLTPTDQADWASIIEVPREAWNTDAHVSHEIAHQWWGGKAGIRSTRDQWFSEGFADYGSVLYLEALDQATGTDWMHGELTNWRDSLVRDDRYVNTIAPLALGQRCNSNENRRGFEGPYFYYIYNKGGYVMHMLRVIARARMNDKAAGDELFKRSMRSFLDATIDRPPSNLDLLRSLEASYGMKLDWYFKQWIYGTGIPKITFSHQVVPAADGKGWMIRGRIQQADTAWTLPVSVFVHQKGEKRGSGTFFYQWVRKADETFEAGPIPFQPDDVTINDDLGLLAIVENAAWEGSAAGE